MKKPQKRISEAKTRVHLPLHLYGGGAVHPDIFGVIVREHFYQYL